MPDDIRIESRLDPSMMEGSPTPSVNGAGSLGDLFRQLADDSRTLIRQEVTLAKVELQANARAIAKGTVVIAIGIGLLLVGLLVLTAFLVLGIGRLLGGEYWLSSLIVGGAFALLGGGALFAGKRGLARDELKPEHTVESLRENRDWARGEVKQIKHDLTS